MKLTMKLPSAAAGLALVGCAGPVTPLGSVWTWAPAALEPATSEALTARAPSTSAPRIRLTPGRQVLHGPAPMRILIEDPVDHFEKEQLSVLYNGKDVTPTFLAQSNIRVKPGRHILIENPVVRLPATEDHRIEMTYRSTRGGESRVRYEPPICDVYGEWKVVETRPFRVKDRLLRMIDRIALEQGVNPAFLTGLIAQESAFDPKQVSWARAIGLTQVTTIAEHEIVREHPDWPRYPGIGRMPLPRLKFMITTGKIHARNEWRLDPEKSVEGGVRFARVIAERWNSPELMKLVRKHYRDSAVAIARLTLASYHSGFSRTLTALERHGKAWLRSRELREARKYVNRVFSYCHHFAEEEEKEMLYAKAP